MLSRPCHARFTGLPKDPRRAESSNVKAVSAGGVGGLQRWGGIAAGWEAKAPRGTSLALQNLTLGCSETKLSGPPVL